MFTKTILLRRKRRLRVIRIILVIGALLVFSPLLLSLFVITLEEVITGKTVGENNSIMGFFLLLAMGPVVFFAVPALILFTLMLLVLLYDAVVIALEVKKSFDEDEENADEGKAWDEGDDEGGGWFRNEHDPPL
jgi:hypothetical protein